jgi:hypothetical protein
VLAADAVQVGALVGFGVWVLVSIAVVMLFEKPYDAIDAALAPYKVAGVLFVSCRSVVVFLWLGVGFFAAEWFAEHRTLSLWIAALVAIGFVGFWLVFAVYTIVELIRAPKRVVDGDGKRPFAHRNPLTPPRTTRR